MSLSVSKKASALVVTTSMATVEALRDYALRSLYQRAVVTGRRAAPASLSSQAANSSAASSSAACAGGRAGRPRLSEEEKLHKAYHIVCWGPN